jgi:hypothetical protein
MLSVGIIFLILYISQNNKANVDFVPGNTLKKHKEFHAIGIIL